MEACERMLQMTRTFFPLYRNLAEAYYDKSRFEDAIRVLEKALPFSHGDSLVKAHLAFSHPLGEDGESAQPAGGAQGGIKEEDASSVAFALVHCGLRETLRPSSGSERHTKSAPAARFYPLTSAPCGRACARNLRSHGCWEKWGFPPHGLMHSITARTPAALPVSDNGRMLYRVLRQLQSDNRLRYDNPRDSHQVSSFSPGAKKRPAKCEWILKEIMMKAFVLSLMFGLTAFLLVAEEPRRRTYSRSLFEFRTIMEIVGRRTTPTTESATSSRSTSTHRVHPSFYYGFLSGYFLPHRVGGLIWPTRNTSRSAGEA